MVCLVENYIFYADVFFAQNFLVKIVVLYISLLSDKQHYTISHKRGVAKLVGAAFVGTFLELLGLLFIRPYELFIICTYVIEIPCMLFFITRDKNVWFLVLKTCFFTIMLNGLVECMWNHFGRKREYSFLIFISSITLIIFVRIWKIYSLNRKGIYPIKMVHHGRELFLHGYYDSGNCLKDPYGYKGVHIISDEVLEKLIVKDDVRLYIPYQSLGNTNGMMEMFYVDSLCVYGEKEIIQEKVPIGVSEDALFKDKGYEIILNEEVF